ncbi:hypothetical protein KC343_g2250 [Hortaea werneckii]|uniref:Uncharacterized protein n=1 Tax=Hortaea werneckii TaxID=91943 RepID=A0A3M7G8A5_HORWE|nr:hypothetical protein KC352_g7391 [Hortaea werneckii]KAI7571967.1 hypothetical protein KC317_g1172 [Hortaea werneckii]KAI7625019.1 hypothetical protein KC346_g1928 [Hortaea werneckii]KAI7634727.1 hypothetical protein KC343_g2250 [Hortaea werneckii]KAI7679540.1 hypothetical protein KC319_g2707 [Hortaea werneckii]
MPPKEKKENSSGFTARDLDLLAAAIQSTKTPVEIDYKVFAEKAGLGGAPSAKASWHGLKKKMERLNGGGVAVASPGGTPNEKAEKGSKKRKVEDVQEGEDGGEGSDKDETSVTGKAAKKGRKAPAAKAKGKKAAVVKAEAEEEDEHVEGTPMSEGKDSGSGEVNGEEKAEDNATEEVGENIKVEN